MTLSIAKLYYYAECRILFIVMLDAVMLSVHVPFPTKKNFTIKKFHDIKLEPSIFFAKFQTFPGRKNESIENLRLGPILSKYFSVFTGEGKLTYLVSATFAGTKLGRGDQNKLGEGET